MTREIYQVNPPEESHKWTEDEFQRVSVFLDRMSQNKPEYQGPYVSGDCYTQGDIVTILGYQMIAKVDTCDYPAPTPVGDANWLLPDAPARNKLSITDVVYTGMRIHDLQLSYQVQAVRVWLENVTANQNYRLWSYDLNTQIWTAISNVFTGDVLPTAGWLEVKMSEVWINPGDDVALILVQQNSSGSTDYNESYVYTGVSNQETDPGTGNVNRRGDHAQLRISALDRFGLDRYAELQTVVVGTLIKVSSEANASAYIQYEVTGAIADNNTWFNFGVTLVDTGAAGEPIAASDVQVYFEVPVATPTDYVELPDYFLPNPSVSGYKRIGAEGTEELNENAYGVDVVFQQFTKSEDWDILSHSESVGGGGTSYSYDYVKEVNILDIGEVYEPIATLTTPSRPGGTFEVKFAVTAHILSSNRSYNLRTRLNGGAWREYVFEESDITNLHPLFYSFPRELPAGVNVMELEARKEPGANQFDITFANLVIQRVA